MKRMDEPPGRAQLAYVDVANHQNQDTTTNSSLKNFSSVNAVVKSMQPDYPVHCLRPEAIKKATRYFLESFPGNVLYAVKTNPDENVLRYIYAAGVRHFDVASIPEIRLIDGLFKDAEMYFMHPVKSREAIRAAYFEHGVKDFSLDCFEELHKILETTGGASDLGLHIRLALPKGAAQYDLSGKFGVVEDQFHDLLILARKVARRLGVCFHVGSQCMDPDAYRAAMQKISDAAIATGVKIDVVDVGGGFPSTYPGMEPRALDGYMQSIKNASRLPGLESSQLWCEPGRALVAEGGSVIVRVELRKNDALYINDGVYGSLFDAGFPGWVYPVKAMRLDGKPSSKLKEYRLFGPTCDSLDAMKGPFLLPEDMKEGDWIEIGQLGAYGATMQTRFNGFYSDTVVEVMDAPQMTLFASRRLGGRVKQAA